MAGYVTSAPPKLLMGSFTNSTFSPAIWTYYSTDAASTVDASGYITNAKDLGMKVSDIVLVQDTDASPIIITTHRVVTINTDGSADLSNGDTLVTGTNSD